MNAKMVAIARTPRMKRPSWKAKAGTSRKAGTPIKLAIKTSTPKDSLKCSSLGIVRSGGAWTISSVKEVVFD